MLSLVSIFVYVVCWNWQWLTTWRLVKQCVYILMKFVWELAHWQQLVDLKFSQSVLKDKAAQLTMFYDAQPVRNRSTVWWKKKEKWRRDTGWKTGRDSAYRYWWTGCIGAVSRWGNRSHRPPSPIRSAENKMATQRSEPIWNIPILPPRSHLQSFSLLTLEDFTFRWSHASLKWYHPRWSKMCSEKQGGKKEDGLLTFQYGPAGCRDPTGGGH